MQRASVNGWVHRPNKTILQSTDYSQYGIFVAVVTHFLNYYHLDNDLIVFYCRHAVV